MKYLLTVFIVLLIPTASFAKGECKEERKKFCQGLQPDGGQDEASIQT